MRFLVAVAQFAGILFAFSVLGSVLPLCLLSCFTSLARIFLCVYLSVWIVELTQDYLLKSKVSSKNRAVLVTGCDSGFGNAIAKRLDAAGFKIYACCLDPSSDGARKLKDTCSNLLELVHLDVTDAQSVQRAKDFVENDLESRDLWAVVNNAGVLKGFHMELCSMKDFEDCMQVNALGPVRVTRAFLPLLRKSRGRVVNVCSASGRHPSFFMGAYTMSKHAAVAFTEVATQELIEFGIRVISVEPEFFSTAMSSEKYLKNTLENVLDDVDEKVEAEYGKQYIQKAMQCYLAIFRSASPNISHVLDAIEKGVTLRYPADVYKPCGSLIRRLFFFFVERLPRILKHATTIFVLYFMGLPKPKSGINLFFRFLNM